jgi:hypothetical protein
MNLAEYFGSLDNYNIILISKRKSIFELPKNIKVKNIYSDIYNCDFVLMENSIIIHLARTNTNDLTDFKCKESKLKNYINKFKPKKIIAFSSSIIYID